MKHSKLQAHHWAQSKLWKVFVECTIRRGGRREGNTNVLREEAPKGFHLSTGWQPQEKNQWGREKIQKSRSVEGLCQSLHHRRWGLDGWTPNMLSSPPNTDKGWCGVSSHEGRGSMRSETGPQGRGLLSGRGWIQPAGVKPEEGASCGTPAHAHEIRAFSQEWPVWWGCAGQLSQVRELTGTSQHPLPAERPGTRCSKQILKPSQWWWNIW